MQYQVRTYTVRPEDMDRFVDAWLAGVIPLREAFGFVTTGAWATEDTFTWILARAEAFEEADRRYYASDERRSLDPDPARFIVDVSEQMARRIV